MSHCRVEPRQIFLPPFPAVLPLLPPLFSRPSFIACWGGWLMLFLNQHLQVNPLIPISYDSLDDDNDNHLEWGCPETQSISFQYWSKSNSDITGGSLSVQFPVPNTHFLFCKMHFRYFFSFSSSCFRFIRFTTREPFSCFPIWFS